MPYSQILGELGIDEWKPNDLKLFVNYHNLSVNDSIEMDCQNLSYKIHNHIFHINNKTNVLFLAKNVNIFTEHVRLLYNFAHTMFEHTNYYYMCEDDGFDCKVYKVENMIDIFAPAIVINLNHDNILIDNDKKNINIINIDLRKLVTDGAYKKQVMMNVYKVLYGSS